MTTDLQIRNTWGKKYHYCTLITQQNPNNQAPTSSPQRELLLKVPPPERSSHFLRNTPWLSLNHCKSFPSVPALQDEAIPRKKRSWFTTTSIPSWLSYLHLSISKSGFVLFGVWRAAGFWLIFFLNLCLINISNEEARKPEKLKVRHPIAWETSHFTSSSKNKSQITQTRDPPVLHMGDLSSTWEQTKISETIEGRRGQPADKNKYIKKTAKKGAFTAIPQSYERTMK